MKQTLLHASRHALICLTALVAPHAAQADQSQEFMKSSTAFFTESETFEKESTLLIRNTQEVDDALVKLENALSVPHKLATALKKLDNTLDTIKQMLGVAKLVPQTKTQAENLEQRLNAIHPNVKKAAASAEKFDKSVEPFRDATNMAEEAAATCLVGERTIQQAAFGYVNTVEALANCVEKQPSTEPPAITLLNRSSESFVKINAGMKKANETYDTTVGMPAKALQATIDEILRQVKQMEELLAAVNRLQGDLGPLNDALAELKKVLDQSVSVSFDYPCGPKMCSQKVPYPCGVKTCKKWGASYPCGTKWCDKEAPYVCGVTTCDAGVSMSVGTIINSANEIERKIEAMLSSTAWEALKVIGVSKAVDDLKKKANDVFKPVMSRLRLDFPVDLPNLNLPFDVKPLTDAVPKFTQLGNSMMQFSKIVSLENPAFGPNFGQLEKLKVETTGLLRNAGCIVPAPKATRATNDASSPFKPPQNWRKLKQQFNQSNLR